MSVALRLYEQLTEAGEDKTRAKLIAEAFEHLEDRYPQLKDVELKLQQTEIRLMGAIHRQTYWIIGSVGTIIGFIRFLDWMLAHVPK